MVASWMIYIALVSATVTIAAVLVERAFRATRTPARLLWVAGICFPLLVAIASSRLPMAAQTRQLLLPAGELSGGLTGQDHLADSRTRLVPRPIVIAVSPNSRLAMLDSTLLALWLTGCLLTFGVFGGAALRLRRIRTAGEVRDIDGVRVSITPSTGPLVVGVLHPQILIPKWVLELDRSDQQLVVAHEQEHLRARDPALLAFGALAVSLTPWNPFAWYMLRKLGQAIELDCDRRVLAERPDLRAYAQLLLSVASRRHPNLLPLAGLATSTSSLEQRFRSMTMNSTRHRGYRTVSALAVVALLLVATAMIPRPIRGTERSASPPDTTAFFEYQVDEPVVLRETFKPAYPPALKSSGISGEVWAQFVVDETGRVDMRTFKALKSADPQFTAAVKAVLPKWRLDPAIKQGKKVKQIVQQGFVFGLPPQS